MILSNRPPLITIKASARECLFPDDAIATLDDLIGYCVTRCPDKDEVVLTGKEDDLANGAYTAVEMQRCDNYAILTDGLQYMVILWS